MYAEISAVLNTVILILTIANAYLAWIKQKELARLRKLTHTAKFGQANPTPGQGDLWLTLIDQFDNTFADIPLSKAEQLKKLFAARRMMGIKKYGTPLQKNNGRNALKDYQEELLDAIVYGSACASMDVKVLVRLLAETDLSNIPTASVDTNE